MYMRQIQQNATKMGSHVFLRDFKCKIVGILQSPTLGTTLTEPLFITITAEIGNEEGMSFDIKLYKAKKKI